MMNGTIPDMLFAVFFLLALILVARFRNHINSVDKASYNYLSGGLVILAFLSLARVYDNLGFFKNVPFLSEPLFFQLVSWIGVITGITFIVSGVSSWLPLAQNFKKNNTEKIRQLDFIKKVEQLVSFETRLDNILENSLDYMVEHFDLKHGLVFKFSPVRHKVYLVAFRGKPTVNTARLESVRFDDEGWRNYLEGVRLENAGVLAGLNEIIGQPDVILPLVVNDKPIVFFALWCHSQNLCDREGRLNLKIAADIITRKIQSRQMTLRETFISRVEKLKATLRDSITMEKNLKENLAAVCKILKTHIPADYLSMVVVNHGTSRMHRFTVGINETVLEEKNINMLGNNYITGLVMDSGQSQIINDLNKINRTDLETIFKSNRLRAVAAIPLLHGRQIEGVFMTAAEEKGCYSPSHVEMLNHITPLLMELLSLEKNREEVAVRERRISLINGFVNEIGQHVSIQNIFEKAAAVIYEEIKTTLVKISTVEERARTLKPRVFRVQPSVNDFIPLRRTIPVSMMPCHKQVVKTGRQMLVTQSATGERMSDDEARIVLNRGLATALLVPVKLRERVFAVITLAERRAWKRFQYSHLDVLFINSIALALSMALQLYVARRKTMPGQDSHHRFMQTQNKRNWDGDFRTRVKSALTGIMGSVEILKTQPTMEGTGQERYLNIIDRSARKINECLLGEKAEVR
ncbi:MAG: GAF domain-containing protein [candidate division Zixibacteria bacterium]|nr:GAF domain-containing protein [candidate division Zixibacteria bacterium]